MATGRGVLPHRAIQYLRSKGRAPSDHWTDVWREEHAVAFTAARMAEDDVLEQVHRALVRALARGETMETFRGRLQPWLEAAGWDPPARGGSIPRRLERIYETNMRTAYAAGRWDRILRDEAAFPWLVYALGPSEVHREQHAAWAGLCLRVRDPWWSVHYPPNGWGCKCHVERVAEPPPGARTEPPAAAQRQWRDPATGNVRIVADEGIDPGWDYNVGAVRTLGVNRALGDRLESILAGRRYEAAPPAVRERIAERMLYRHVHGPGFAWFVERPRARIENPLDPADAKRAKMRWEETRGRIQDTPVGLLSPAAAELMDTAARIVRLNERVMHKQALHHPELALGRYRAVLDVLRGMPTPDATKERRWLFEQTIEVDGRLRSMRVVVEVDRETGPVVVSVHQRKPKRNRPAG